MKSAKVLFLFLFAFLVFFSSQQLIKANVFPFYIHVTQPDSEDPFDGDFSDGTFANIRFMIQDTVLTSDVAIAIKSGATTLKTLNLTGIKGGYHSVLWNGRDDANVAVSPGSYTIEVTASQTTGHATYQLIYLCPNPGSGQGLSTRGATINNNPNSKNFNFAYAVTTAGGGAWNFTGLGRVAGNGLLFGDILGNAQLTTTGEILGSSNRRYGPAIDSDGYIYVVGRNEKEVLRFHTDSLNVSIFIDTIPTAGQVNAVNVSGNGTNKYLWISSTTGIFGAAIGESTVYTGAIDSLIPAPDGFQYWDVLPGDGDALYAVINKPTQAVGNGVLKFNMPTPGPKTVADTVWYVQTPEGDAVGLDIWRGSTSGGDDDILYLSYDDVSGSSAGVYGITNLTSTSPAIDAIFLDPTDNTSRTRAEPVVDYAGNIIFFENSSEEIYFISPPSGPNSNTITALDPLIISTPVPVELVSFAANVFGNSVKMNWTTATETNNKGFEVQRKTTGSNFVTIGYVKGKGTTTEAQSYSFVDNDVQAGSYSYRLKQIDLDGSYSYSDVVEVTIASPIEYNLAQNYPNPFNPSTTINFSLAKESYVSLRIFDLLGQEIMALVNNEFKSAGSYSYKFDASSLSSGTYIYRLEAGDFVQTKKMTLTK